LAVLVTGGAGYVGSTVIRDLLSRGEEVISVDNLYRGDYRHLSAQKVDFRLRMMEGDITSTKEIKDSLEGVDNLSAVVHLAAVSGLDSCQEEPKKAVLTNVLGTLNILEIARVYDASVFFASSAAVFGVPRRCPITEDHPRDPINLYGVSKLAGENLVNAYSQNYGLNNIILRFGNIFGVGLFTYWDTVIPKFVRQAIEGKPLTVYGSGDQGRDFVHVLDVSRAILLALDNEDVSGETFNLAGATTISVNSVANMVSEVLKHEYGKDVETVHLPPRKGEPHVKDFRYSIDKIKIRLGFKPRWTVRHGIEQVANYLTETTLGR
jgi:UDP-glucose 4-epimerase